MGGIPLPDRGTQGETIMLALGDELAAVEDEISRQHLARERATYTYRLEQLVRERDRLTRHLASVRREGSNV